jgi:hypothetical protein
VTAGTAWRRRLRGGLGDALVAAAVALTLAAAALRGTDDPAPGIELAPPEIGLGAIPEGEERSVTLSVSNRGPAPVEVAIAPSCTCVTPSRGPFEIGPRSNVTFDVTVSTERRPGYNVAFVQIADAAGRTLGQSRVTFTTVRSFVLDPPVVFLHAGEERAPALAHCLAPRPPRELAAVTDDPAVTAAVERVGPRTWAVTLALRGRPVRRLAAVRLVARGDGGEERAGVLIVSLPASRIGDVRRAQVASRAPDGGLRAWVLVDAETRRAMRLLSAESPPGHLVATRCEPATTDAGSHLWIELAYDPSAAGSPVALEVEVGDLRERVVAVLPREVDA